MATLQKPSFTVSSAAITILGSQDSDRMMVRCSFAARSLSSEMMLRLICYSLDFVSKYSTKFSHILPLISKAKLML